MCMKSEQDKRLSGHYRENRSKRVKGDALRLPKCSHPISNKAKKFRRIVFEYLRLHGAAYKCDFMVLDQFCWVYDTIDTAIEKVGYGANAKLTQRYKSGVEQVSPQMSNFTSLNKTFLEYCKLFGITPKYRQDIEALVGQIEHDEEGEQLSRLAMSVNGNLVLSE